MRDLAVRAAVPVRTLALLALAVALMAAGCGGSSKATASTSTTAPASSTSLSPSSAISTSSSTTTTAAAPAAVCTSQDCTYTNPAAEASSGVAHVREVEVTKDASVDGYLDFNVGFSNPPIGTTIDAWIYLDTDRDPHTGIATTGDTSKSGSDYWIYLKASAHTAAVYKLGTQDASGNYHGNAVANAVLSSSLGFNQWGVTVARTAIGNPASFKFWIKTTDDGQGLEFLPVAGTYTYPAT
jgi:hypothetical protein